VNVEKVANLLGEYVELFTVSEKEGFVVAKPKNKIPILDFSKVGRLVREANGEYVPYDYNTKTGGEFRFKSEELKPTHTSDVTVDRVATIHGEIETIRRALLNVEAELAKLKETEK